MKRILLVLMICVIVNTGSQLFETSVKMLGNLKELAWSCAHKSYQIKPYEDLVERINRRNIFSGYRQIIYKSLNLNHN